MAHHDLNTVQLSSRLQGESLSPQRSAIKTDLLHVNGSQRAKLPTAEGLYLTRIRFGHVPRGIDLSVHDDQNSLADGLRIDRYANGIPQISRAIGVGIGGRALCADQ